MVPAARCNTWTGARSGQLTWWDKAEERFGRRACASLRVGSACSRTDHCRQVSSVRLVSRHGLLEH
eukprot:2391352-Prymnesium_polylepis.2